MKQIKYNKIREEATNLQKQYFEACDTEDLDRAFQLTNVLDDLLYKAGIDILKEKAK